MAGKKISELTALTSVDTDDVLPIVDTSATETKKITRANLVTGASHTTLTDIGTNTHAQIDTFIGTKAQASGLASLNSSTKVVEDPANATETATASKIPIADGSGKIDTWVSDASTTTKGKVELTIASEVDTGTSTTLAITPDSFAGSSYGKRVVEFVVVAGATDTAVGDKVSGNTFRVPAEMNGWNLVGVSAHVETAGTTGTTDIQIRNVTQAADMLSTKITIDSGETDSLTAATAAVIDANNDDVATGDKIAIDVDAVSTTAAKGLTVTMVFQLP